MKNKIRIVGFSVALSYLIAILYTWMSAELTGHVYFMAGEPDRAILYTEWVLGFLTIIMLASELKKVLDEKEKVIYDPLV